ncbi:TBC1 domain family member 15 [Ochlerotatus camptorhynchus]|uniref:TBC1 domain family member 15 n=1 Tax=Ochlerotatus camptorhynchus TaxID=644619 RepID=UPI0031D15ECE
MDNESTFEEIFIQHGVTLKKASASYMSALNTIGVLYFCKYHKGNVHFFEWKVTEMCEIMDTDSQDSDWSLVHTLTVSSDKTSDENPNAENDSQKNSKITIRVLFRDLRGIEFSKNELRLYNQDLTVHSLYLFNHGSPHSFVDFLERKRFVRRSTRRKHFYHCLEEADNDKLQKSFSELNIEDIRNRPRTTNNYMGLLSRLANVHQILPLSKQPGETRTRISPPQEDGATSNGTDEVNGSKSDESNEAECNKLAPRPDVHRGESLDAKKWAEFRASNGSITDADRVKDIIFRGGITDEIRAEVWKYLLDLDIWDHTTAQREERRMTKTEEYFLMKLQWQTMTDIQERNFTGYRERKCQIEKDVKRTDRTYDFFAGDNNPNLAKLQEILMTYVMYNFDLGYVQGMSDLLAPILCLVQNQADSFWCFVGFMDKVFNNFDIDQKGMKQQLEHLRTLLAFVNEKLYKYLTDNQSENMYFCFRWLLVWFKREFSNSDIMHLWEVLWTGLPCPNFHLFICVAILDQEMDIFINGQFTFTEILKHVNELSGNLNVTAVLEQAESIYLQVKKTLDSSKEPHLELRKIIGEKVSPDGTGSTGSDEDDDSCMSIVNDKSSEDQEMMQRKIDEACDMSLSFAFF